MSPHPHRAGIGSILIDLILVTVILTCLGVLLYSAFAVVAWAVRGVAGLFRRGGDDQ